MLPVELLAATAACLPGAAPAELFRMCLLLSHCQATAQPLANSQLPGLIRDLQLKLAMAEDQQAGLAVELDSLASTEPCEFHLSQLWTLIRAIKVQSQLLDLYTGPQAVLIAPA